MGEPRAAVVLGTRPEIIKLAGVLRTLKDSAYVVHTGQHYDESLSSVFLRGFGLPDPEVVLHGVGGAGRGEQVAAIIAQLTVAFTEDRPGAVVVQGDTNTAAAGALAAHMLGIPVVHVEAGLRSYDRAMPEEINRQLVGVVADVHCAPTETSARNLRAEGVAGERIIVTGNTVIEATRLSLPVAEIRESLLRRHGVRADEFVLATIHRPENTDDPMRLRWILEALAALEVPVLLPLHPRTRAAVHRHGLDVIVERLLVSEPLDHPSFLGLAAAARLLVSDSGGVQEECTVIKRPLVVLRNSTERPEAVDAGFARRFVPSAELARQLRDCVSDALWPRLIDRLGSPYGDGTASLRIAELIRGLLLGSVDDPSAACGVGVARAGSV